jgi:hypothetical protein
MTERTIGTALQFVCQGDDLAEVLRQVAASIEALGPGAEVLDVTVRPDQKTVGVYFIRND